MTSFTARRYPGSRRGEEVSTVRGGRRTAAHARMRTALSVTGSEAPALRFTAESAASLAEIPM